MFLFFLHIFTVVLFTDCLILVHNYSVTCCLEGRLSDVSGQLFVGFGAYAMFSAVAIQSAASCKVIRLTSRPLVDSLEIM